MSSSTSTDSPLRKDRSFSTRINTLSPRKKTRSGSTNSREDSAASHKFSDKEKQKSGKIILDRYISRSLSKNHNAVGTELASSNEIENESSSGSDVSSLLLEMAGKKGHAGDEKCISFVEEEYVMCMEDTPENSAAVVRIQSYVRGLNVELELEKMIKWQVQRTHILQEIVATEESYYKGLETLVNDVYEPVHAVIKDDPILELTVFKSLFPEGHIKIIYSAHTEILEDLRRKRESWSHHETVGDVFIKMCKFLRLYTKYAETYSEVEATLDHIFKKEKKFVSFLKAKWPDKGDVIGQLSSLLITPIQRIPRYQMLLDSLYKQTWTSHSDYNSLGIALEQMKKTAQHVNDKAKEADNAKKLVLIDNSLIGLKKSLVAANRKFIKEGFLHHRTEKGEWKKRYFFLFSDCMIRTRPNRKQKGPTYIFIEKVTLRQGKVSHLGSDIESEVDEDHRSRSFEFNQPHPVRYVLCASTVDEKRDWWTSIQRALDEMNEADREHEEVVKKISVQKAHMAKNLIAASLMQHATVTPGSTPAYRERLSGKSQRSALVNNKSQTADASTVRAYKEHMVAAKMTTQEKWEQTKQAQQDVQNWEISIKKQEAAKQIEEALLKRSKKKDTEEKKKEIHKQLNSLGRGDKQRYHDALLQYKQGRAAGNNSED